jgi:hypothetical protein
MRPSAGLLHLITGQQAMAPKFSAIAGWPVLVRTRRMSIGDDKPA